MAFKKREPRHDWRSKLTAEERELVKVIEREQRAAKKAATAAAAKLAPIRNRAIQRCRAESAR